MFKTFFDVRDYECDIEGIVNNSVYLNYMEHARHKYIKNIGIDFAKLAMDGLHLVVTRAEIDYLGSLKSGDSFYVTVEMKRETRLKMSFLHTVCRCSDHKVMCSGKVFGVGLNKKGRPERLEKFGIKLED